MKNPASKLDSPTTPVRSQKINRIAARTAIGLSTIALLCVFSGFFQPRQTDEGSAAHIFQISIAALLPTLLIFLFSADWQRPTRSAQPLIFPAAALAIAFAALFYLEHYR